MMSFDRYETLFKSKNIAPKPIVLEENKYYNEIGRIIERDFFPDLEKLRIKKQYMEAMDKNDIEKVRLLQLHWETILKNECDMRSSQQASLTIEDYIKNDRKESYLNSEDTLRISLNDFLANYTSEDNYCFDKIVEESQIKLKEKYGWVQERAHLTAMENCCDENLLAIDKDTDRRSFVQTLMPYEKPAGWSYKVQNELMFNPPTIPHTPEEIIANASKAKLKINHSATRQKIDHDTKNLVDTLQDASIFKMKQAKAIGKIGVDGKIEQIAYKSKNYDYVHTPSVVPGVGESPIMTWGSIEGTPINASTPPSGFKMPMPPVKERIGLVLEEKAAKRRRSALEKASKQANASIASAKILALSPANSNMNSLLSPAAQKLIKRTQTSLRNDIGLAASYSPAGTFSSGRTPLHSPSITPRKTPKCFQTPQSQFLNQEKTSINSNLTDDLLKL